MRQFLGLATVVILGSSLLASCSSEESEPAAASCEGQALNLGQGTGLSLIYAPLYVAEKKGYVEDEDIKLEHTTLGAGSESIQALVGGSIDVVATPFASIATARERGAPVVAFASFANANTAAVGIKNKFAPADDADLRERVLSLKGLRVGVTSPGSGSDQTIRYLAKQAGLDPDKDMTIVGTGGTSEVVAAFAKGSIDAYVIGAPASDVAAEQGDGQVIIRLANGDDPSQTEMLYGVVATTQKTLESKRTLFECYARALSKADAFIKSNPDEAAELLRPDFPELDQAAFDSAWGDVVATTPTSAAVLEKEAEKAAAFLGVLNDRDVDVSEAYTTEFNSSLD